MALPVPLIPLLIGAAVGATVTYLLTTKSARSKVPNALEELGDAVEEQAEAVASAAEEKVQETTKATKRTASKAVD